MKESEILPAIDASPYNHRMTQAAPALSDSLLAAARAIAVAQMLISEGLPANRVAAASFGDAQPIDQGDTPQAFARNRRIELRLTDR